MQATIIGTGQMGKGLVQIFSQSPNIAHIIWLGRDVARLKLGLRDITTIWQKQISKGKITTDHLNNYLNKIEISDEAKHLCGSDLVIEAVSECLDVKKSVFSDISKHTTENTLIASNTSSLSITEIANSVTKPENFIGMHFFNPPAIMKLVELIVGLKTSEMTICRAKEIALMLGKEPILVKETPGFIVNRMLIPMINEAIGLLAEGVAEASEIDKAMLFGANHPIGPLALADLIGNDIILAIMETLKIETGDPKYRPHPLLRKMVRAHLLGRKTNQGFFHYAKSD